MTENDRFFWLIILSFLIVVTVLLLIEHSRMAILVIIATVFCGLMYRFQSKQEGKNAKSTKRA